jgi:hypothetical protein
MACASVEILLCDSFLRVPRPGYPWAVGSAPLTLAAGRLWVTRVMLLPVDSRGDSLGQTPACLVLAPQAADFPV